MKENPQKYAEVYADKSCTAEEKEGNIRRRRKRNVCTDATLWDNEKSTQVHLCCGKEVDNVEQKCQVCSTKRVNVVENSTQAYFIDIDGYVDEHLQKQLLECTQSGRCTQDIIVTPKNDCCDIVDKDGMISMHEKIVTHENVCIHDNSCATNTNNIATEDRVVKTSCQTDITSANCKITGKRLQFGPKTFRRNV